ncbi:NAD kinase [uncultured archaeon]|nr:NAD kinase [uncultured archaeon]
MPKISRALVLANARKPIAVRLKKEVDAFLRHSGVRISPLRPQMVVAIGGDGTILYYKKHYGTPFFAIGSNSSFMCQAKFSDWKHRLSAALGRPRLDRRLLLSCSVNGRKMPPALNEIRIRNPEPRVISLHLMAGKKHFAFRADGMLFSTPTGATAYCYSCGGKEMKKNDARYQLVAISPFRRLFPPTLVSGKAKCSLRISGPEKAQLFIDGQEFGMVSEKDTLHIEAGKKPFYFVKA